MPTVLSPEFKQITVPHPIGEEETGIKGRKADEKPTVAEQNARNVQAEVSVVRFDPVTKTAEVSQEVADELVRLFPQSVVVLPDAPKPKPAKEPAPPKESAPKE